MIVILVSEWNCFPSGVLNVIKAQIAGETGCCFYFYIFT